MYFSRTFKALNFDFQIQGFSGTFKVRANPGDVSSHVFQHSKINFVSPRGHVISPIYIVNIRQPIETYIHFFYKHDSLYLYTQIH